MDNGSCERCRWWDNSTQQASAQPDTTGACRVRPPRINKITGGAMWPFTTDTDWCGDYSPDPDDSPF
jgi:hypothetical protein